MQLILGIDPGSRVTGYAALACEDRQMTVKASGAIRLPSGANLEERLGELQRRVGGLLEELGPQAVAVEDIFHHRNARSALLLAHARGVVLANAAQYGLQVWAHSPAAVKRAVVGHGRAEKAQVQQMVCALLSLEQVPVEDEADAMAVAICHAMNQRSTMVGAADGAAGARNSGPRRSARRAPLGRGAQP